ncbi:MAG: GAF domain-containing protein [Streptosporangiaceae bacterium]|nr:GAF domain-containing protein [Streptosporangiaceae bacterium]MBV9853389.1 GAF domain-containing protein [Streptosporangiaceae bacterium]
MRIAPGARVYLTTVIALVAVGVASWCGMQAGTARAGRQWWTLGAVAASVIAAGVPAYEQVRKEQMRSRAQQAAIDAAVAMRVAMNDGLDPIVRQLGRAATTPGRQERAALREGAVAMALDSAAHLAGSGRVRACLFEFAPGTPRVLVPAQYSGRVDDPLEPIAEGTAEGDLVFGMIRHNQHLFCPDLDAGPLPGWRVPEPQTYKSFAAVPVAAGPNAFGMLMVDALDGGAIGRADVPLIRLLAGLVAIALA